MSKVFSFSQRVSLFFVERLTVSNGRWKRFGNGFGRPNGYRRKWKMEEFHESDQGGTRDPDVPRRRATTAETRCIKNYTLTEIQEQ